MNVTLQSSDRTTPVLGPFPCGRAVPSAQNDLHLPHRNRFNLLLRIQVTWALAHGLQVIHTNSARYTNSITGHIFFSQRGASLALPESGIWTEKTSTEGAMMQQSGETLL